MSINIRILPPRNYQGLLGFLAHFIYQTLGGKENFAIEIMPSQYKSEIDSKIHDA